MMRTHPDNGFVTVVETGVNEVIVAINTPVSAKGAHLTVTNPIAAKSAEYASP